MGAGCVFSHAMIKTFNVMQAVFKTRFIWQKQLKNTHSISDNMQILDEKHTSIISCDEYDDHDDVIKWKHFPHYWPSVTSEFPAQRPVTWSFDVFFDQRLN